MKLVIALGGTGQLVLHHYLQWYLLGLTDSGQREPFRALLIDPDTPSHMASLRFAASFFEQLCPGSVDPFGLPASWMRMPHLDAPGEGTLEAILTAGDPNPLHPARAFFDQLTLAQAVNVGLFARPAVAPSLWAHPHWGGAAQAAIRDAVEQCGGASHARVVVVGSLLGGTGGGLLMPVLDLLTHGLHVSQTSAVLLGPYFESTAEQAALYSSNWQALAPELAERYQAEGAYKLRRVCLLGAQPNRLKKRDPGIESRAKQLPWPVAADSDPLAEACWAVAESLSNMVAAVPPTADAARLPFDTSEVAGKWGQAAAARDQAIRGLALLGDDATVTNAACDPFAGVIYGAGLPRVLRAALDRYVQTQGQPAPFLEALHREIRVVISDGAYSIRALFPPAAWEPSRAELRRRTDSLPQLRLGHATTKAEVLATVARAVVSALLRSER